MEIEKKEKEISPEELQLYDRQRFIGIEVQKRLLNAVVLITPLNGVNTELAKNLILSGTNITIADNEVITSDDVEQNFLIAPSEIGKIRGQVVGKKLIEMNPMVKIEILNTLDINKFYDAYYSANKTQNYEDFSEDFLNKFNIVTSSVQQFAKMQRFEEITMKLNIPYYNLVCCGFYGYYYVNLGKSFDFIKKKPQRQVIKDGQKKLEDEYEDFQKIQIIGQNLESTLDPTKNSKPVYKAIQAMYEAEKRNIIYDCYNHNEQIYQSILKISEEKNFKFRTADQKEAFDNFVKFYGVEYCPVYSIIGSVASQEFIKVIGKDSEPGINWFVYDSQEGSGKIENIQGDKNYIRTDLPELRRKIDPATLA